MKLERSVFVELGFYGDSWLDPEGFESGKHFKCYWLNGTCKGYMNRVYNHEKHYFI